MYLFGLLILTKKYETEGIITVMDIILLLMAPVSMLSVFVIRLTSTFVDTDAIIVMRKDEE
jgi:hypothetical protein